MTAEHTLHLAAHGDREILMSRTFDAPRAHVFDAYTKPELLRRWLLGPPGWEMVVCEVDLRVGGAFRYVWKKNTGVTMGMHGEYREIVRPARLVNTEIFDDPWYPGVGIVTLEFTESRGQTTATTTITYETREIRDGVLKSGMEKGVAHSYDLLADMLRAMPAAQ